MKKTSLFLLIMAGLFSSSCEQKNSKSAEESVSETQIDSPVGLFGEEINESGVVTLDMLVAKLEKEQEFEGKVIGEIKEVCAMKGCWMTIDLPNGESMRVTFKDYGFFVPKNAHGYPVIIEGIASKKVTDVETLKHYADDAGKSKEEIDAITTPKLEYAFEAIGVIIKENA
ncbi:DUF4920 domain-containing protein [Cyclobacteriaceae bacterium YHN15]|nr:DUF4920 domain-containing protein [Cyclobacteriaceae bacterium YHN15]